LRPVQANTGCFRRSVTPVNTQMRRRGHRIGPMIGKIDGQAGFLGFFRDFGGA